MAQTTPNYSLNIAEGTDTVNLLTQCYPNFSTLDTVVKGIDDNAITVASETKSGTVHQLVRSNVNRNVIRFSATSNFTLGDTFTVDGTPVTAVTVAGTALQTGDFVINSNVIAVLNGALLTVYAGGSIASLDAADVVYDNTGSGLTATNAQDAIDEVAGGLTAAGTSYDNTLSGLTAADVQSAIDELAAIPSGSKVSLLFSNPDTTVNWGTDPITLSSDDYDLLLFTFRSTTTSGYCLSQIAIKGSDVEVTRLYPGGGNPLNLYGRRLTYASDTSYSVGAATAQALGSAGGMTSNNHLIPYKVYGIKL